MHRPVDASAMGGSESAMQICVGHFILFASRVTSQVGHKSFCSSIRLSEIVFVAVLQGGLRDVRFGSVRGCEERESGF